MERKEKVAGGGETQHDIDGGCGGEDKSFNGEQRRTTPYIFAEVPSFPSFSASATIATEILANMI